nr:RsmB/NOP family class I SAM-dependent RNA methyltransferase [Octadecabacter dasysiphoniae]
MDVILDGASPEKALTGWGRGHRFAGSKDRAAIRDHVFSALRCRASFAWRGGAATGRGIMLGATQADGSQDAMFNGEGHAPRPRDADEIGRAIEDAPRDVRLDVPEWLLPHFDGSLGEDADAALTALQSRAGVFLRVNLRKVTREKAAEILAEDGIKTEPVANVSSALHVIENERRVAQSRAYAGGLVELQDTSSQAAIEALKVTAGLRVLDLCAGGGGKALAMAAFGADVTAHDIDPGRMVDLAPRAERAGVEIATVTTDQLASCDPFDLVLCDAPCSGSGTWRRTPAAKWALTPERLIELTTMQDDVLGSAVDLVRAGGTLAYATCSVFEVENNERVQLFIERSSSFDLVSSHLTMPHARGDGFYLCVMKRR